MSEVEKDHNYYAHKDSYELTGFWGKAAAGCLFLSKETGRFLIAQRSDDVLEPRTWSTWGGAIDMDESPSEAVRREVCEETEFDGEVNLVPMVVFAHESGFRYHNFIAVVDHEFDPVLNSETQSYEWVDFEDITPENFNLHPGMKYLLQQSGQDMEDLACRSKSKKTLKP